MLLPYILTQLDAELDRLHRLRDIVAGLGGIGVAALAETVLSEELPASLPEIAAPQKDVLPVGEVKRLRRFPGRRGPRAKPATEKEVSAFAPAPAGIVVVSAQALERERAHRDGRRPANGGDEDKSAPEPQIAPEDLARSLAARWLSGADGEGRGA